MKSGIRLFVAGVAASLAVSSVALADAFDEIVRTAALRNGFLPASQLYNDVDAELAEIGRVLFESKNISLNGQMSCRTCHLDEFGSADGLPNAIGVFGDGEGPKRAFSDGRIVPRNALPLWGRGGPGFDTFFWDGKIDFSDGEAISQFGKSLPSDDALVTAVHLPPTEIVEMLIDDDSISGMKEESQKSAAMLYQEVMAHLATSEANTIRSLATALGKAPQSTTFLDVARSIAAFIRSEFRIKETRFHRFVFGQGELTRDELEGALIFYGKGKCVNCHTGPYFSDLDFHAMPFPQLGFGKNGFGIDYGRFNVTFRADDLYKFRTPPLFNVERTSPYGHSGSIANLSDVIVAHFDPLRFVDTNEMDTLSRHELFKRIAATGDSYKLIGTLDDEEVQQVESFLRTLSIE